MDCSMSGLPVHHQFLEFTQTHVHWISDAIQLSRPLLSPSPPSFNLSQHQGLFPMNLFFTSGGQSIRVSASASVLPINIQDWFPLGWTGWISLLSKGLSRAFSNNTVQKHQFFSAQLSFCCPINHIQHPSRKARLLEPRTGVISIWGLCLQPATKAIPIKVTNDFHLAKSLPSSYLPWQPLCMVDHSLLLQSFPSLLFSHQVVSYSLWPCGLQHTSLLCPPLSPEVCSNSCPLSQWCHPTISSSATWLPSLGFCNPTLLVFLPPHGWLLLLFFPA